MSLNKHPRNISTTANTTSNSHNDTWVVYVTLFYSDEDMGSDLTHVMRHVRQSMRGNLYEVLLQALQAAKRVVVEFGVEANDEIFVVWQVRAENMESGNVENAAAPHIQRGILYYHNNVNMETEMYDVMNSGVGMSGSGYDEDDVEVLTKHLEKTQDEIIAENDRDNEAVLNARTRESLRSLES